MEIKKFKWGENPVELDQLSVLYVSKDGSKEKEYIKNVLNVFPEHICENVFEYTMFNKKKSTLLINERNIGDFNHNYFIDIINREKYHLLVKGNMESIPKWFFTISDIIMFENVDDINRYLTENYKCFNFKKDVPKNLFIIDKRNDDLHIFVDFIV